MYQFGASNEVGTSQINVQYSNTGGSRIYNNTNHKYSEMETVSLKRVDSLLPADHSLDFALIDVERMEGQAILGMEKVLRRSPNLILLVEWSVSIATNRERDFAKMAIEMLVDLGYRIYKY